MVVFFRTKRFDTESKKEDDRFYGQDLAKWLSSELRGWDTNVEEEDWGWAVEASKRGYEYIFGVYDHDTGNVTDEGARWCLRLFNLRDKSAPWYKKLVRYIPPVAHAEVVEEIVALLNQQTDFHNLQTEPLK